MAANGRIVNADVAATSFTWDGVAQRLQRGTVIDVPSGSALETAIGTSNLTALTSQQTSDMGGQNCGPFMSQNVGGGNEPSHSQN